MDETRILQILEMHKNNFINIFFFKSNLSDDDKMILHNLLYVVFKDGYGEAIKDLTDLYGVMPKK